MTTGIEISRPALKPGVRLQGISADYIALVPPGSQMTEALALPSMIRGIDIRAFLRSCDGRSRITALATMSGLELEECVKIIEKLKEKNLVNLGRTLIPYQSRYNPYSQKIESVADVEALKSDPAIETFLEKFEIESYAIQFHDNVVDSGRDSVLRRKDFSILIFGINRIAFHQIGRAHV